MKTSVFATLIVSSLALGISACGGEEDVSLTTEVLPLVQMRCGGCHTRNNSPVPNAVANMVYYEQKSDLLGLVGTFITAGDGANSGIVKVFRQETAVGMGPTNMPPPPSPAVPAAEVDTLVKWIDQGAKDN